RNVCCSKLSDLQSVCIRRQHAHRINREKTGIDGVFTGHLLRSADLRLRKVRNETERSLSTSTPHDGGAYWVFCRSTHTAIWIGYARGSVGLDRSKPVARGLHLPDSIPRIILPSGVSTTPS